MLLVIVALLAMKFFGKSRWPHQLFLLSLILFIVGAPLLLMDALGDNLELIDGRYVPVRSHSPDYFVLVLGLLIIALSSLVPAKTIPGRKTIMFLMGISLSALACIANHL